MKVIDPDPLLTGPQCAERIGVSAGTWRSFVHKGYVPVADEPDADKPPNRRRPQWRASTVDTWHSARPGRGNRTLRRHVVPFSGELR